MKVFLWVVLFIFPGICMATQSAKTAEQQLEIIITLKKELEPLLNYLYACNEKCRETKNDSICRKLLSSKLVKIRKIWC